MTDTPTKQEIQSKNDNVPGAMPGEQKKNNRNDRKRNKRGDSKNLERDSDWQERVVQIRRVSKTVKGGKKMSFRAIVVVGVMLLVLSERESQMVKRILSEFH